jgi:hypothetical protein
MKGFILILIKFIVNHLKNTIRIDASEPLVREWIKNILNRLLDDK